MSGGNGEDKRGEFNPKDVTEELLNAEGAILAGGTDADMLNTLLSNQRLLLKVARIQMLGMFGMLKVNRPSIVVPQGTPGFVRKR